MGLLGDPVEDVGGASTASGARGIVARRARPRLAAAALVGTAAIIHAALTPTHLEEGVVFGVAFLAMAVFQTAVALGLIVRPGPRVDALGRRLSVVLVALYLLTRVVPVPGSRSVEEASPIGFVAVAVELAALFVLSRLPRARPPRLGPVAAGRLAELGTLVAVLLATGSLRWIPFDLSSEYQGTPPVLRWSNESWSARSPLVTVYFTNHLVLYASVLTLLLSIALAVEVGLGVARSRAALLAGGCERRHVFWMPAFLAAPVCCGAPLFGVVGPAAFAALLRYGWAPLALAVAVGAVASAVPNRRRASAPGPP